MPKLDELTEDTSVKKEHQETIGGKEARDSNPVQHVVRIEVAPAEGARASGQQTVVVGPPAVPAEAAVEAEKVDYLEQMEGYCGLNTAMLISTREAFRTELLKLELNKIFSWGNLEDFPTVEDRRKRLPFEDDYLFNPVIAALAKWREGALTFDQAYAGVRYALENPEEMKALAEGKAEEEEKEEEEE